jgi:hypothetical protein
MQITFDEPVSDVLELLVGIAATRVEHYANRARARYAYTDPDAKFCTISVSILLPFDTTVEGEPGINIRSLRGVVQLAPYRTGTQNSSATLIIYEADYHGVRLK